MDIIRIINMHEYNPRKDRKKHAWFRVDNTIPFGPKLFGLTPAQKWFWICLLALASHEQKDWVENNPEYLNAASGVELVDIDRALKHFLKKGVISIEPKPTGDHADTSRLPSGSEENTGGITTDRQTNRRTDGQTDAPESDFRTALMTVVDDDVRWWLKHVRPEAQAAWVKRWGSRKAIAESLAQCLLKRDEKGLKVTPGKVESIFTAWLEKEKNLVEVKEPKEWINPDQGPHTGGPEKLKNLLDNLGVKSLVDTLPGGSV